MFEQTIHPNNKEQLIVKLPEEFIGKDVVVTAIEKTKADPKRKELVKKVFQQFDKKLVSLENFKFNRDEANER